MLMKTEPLLAAIQTARAAVGSGEGKVVYLSPQGSTLDQQKVQELAQRENLILVCGRYQGIDARVLEAEIDEEVSLGDFVLSGGEIAAMALIDAIIRFQPGALGDDDSAQQDSFADGLLHCPQYTRPQSFAGQDVPQILLSGDHAAIRRWRLKQSLGMTWLKRPDLLTAKELDHEQTELLQQFKDEHGN
jgi:tRNA (guanine37-N1)-methyltransferase